MTIKLMPIVYVTDMPRALAFYQALGFPHTTGTRTGSWAELDAGDGAVLALHIDDAVDDPKRGRVELALVATKPLEQHLEELRALGITDVEPIVDEAYGRSVGVRDPEGMRIQLNENDQSLYT